MTSTMHTNALQQVDVATAYLGAAHVPLMLLCCGVLPASLPQVPARKVCLRADSSVGQRACMASLCADQEVLHMQPQQVVRLTIHSVSTCLWAGAVLRKSDEQRCAQSKDVLSSLRARYAVPQLAAAAAAAAAPSAWLSWVACGAVVAASPIPLQVCAAHGRRRLTWCLSATLPLYLTPETHSCPHAQPQNQSLCLAVCPSDLCALH